MGEIFSPPLTNHLNILTMTKKITLCYHNGALGRVALALLETCTHEGGQKFPTFYKKKNFHHYTQKTKLLEIQHPKCDIAKCKTQGKLVLSSTSKSKFGRFLIIVMGLNKWTTTIPVYNKGTTYKQTGDTFQEQLETLSISLIDKVNNDSEWYMDADVVLEIMDYWNNTKAISKVLSSCRLTPDYEKCKMFCQKVKDTNNDYYITTKKCFLAVDMAFKKIQCDVDLNFFETAICYSLVLDRLGIEHTNVPRLQELPTNTIEFMRIIENA